MPDRFVVRAVVLGLLSIVLVVIVAATLLILDESGVPDALWGMGTVALGALAGILARTSTNDDVQNVAVVNTALEPVPVDPA